jgi:hypothetical protein
MPKISSFTYTRGRKKCGSYCYENYFKAQNSRLLTWFVDVDMAVHHARHEDQVPHILNPKARALMKQLRFRRCARCQLYRKVVEGGVIAESQVRTGCMSVDVIVIIPEGRLSVVCPVPECWLSVLYMKVGLVFCT